MTPDYDGEEYDHDQVIDRAFNETMRELVKLGVDDAMVTGSIVHGDIEIHASVEADSPGEAIAKVDPCVRAALHHAGVFTRGWDEGTATSVTLDWQRVEAEPRDVDAESGELVDA